MPTPHPDHEERTDATVPARLTPEDAAAVIRRASELDDPDVGAYEGLDRGAIEAAAAEVGISPAALRRAMAEHDADALTVSPKAGRRSFLGDAYAQAERIVDMRPSVAQAALERWMVKQTFQVRRRSGTSVRWERRDDFAAQVKRRLDFTKRIRLEDPDEIVTIVVPVGEQQSLIRIQASFVSMRQGLKLGMVGFPVVAGPTVGAIFGFATGAVVFPIIGVPAGLAIAAIGSVGGRKTLTLRRNATLEILDGFLDDLEHSP